MIIIIKTEKHITVSLQLDCLLKRFDDPHPPIEQKEPGVGIPGTAGRNTFTGTCRFPSGRDMAETGCVPGGSGAQPGPEAHGTCLWRRGDEQLATRD